MDLIIPNKIHNVHNSSDTFRPYDPNEAIGNTSPTAAKKHKQPCGIFGQILLAVVAVVVAYFTAGAATPFLAGLMGVAETSTLVVTSTASRSATSPVFAAQSRSYAPASEQRHVGHRLCRVDRRVGRSQ
jgi:hypothetical protein